MEIAGARGATETPHRWPFRSVDFYDIQTLAGNSPTSGARVPNEFWRDALGGEWACTSAGTPGTWKQIKPAAVTVDPSNGTIPTGYLILDITDGAVKRHAGTCSWEIKVGATAASKVGLHGATPTVQRAGDA